MTTCKQCGHVPQISCWLEIARYLVTPEDSRDTVYTEPISSHPEYLTPRIKQVKMGCWILVSLLIAWAISRLQ